MQPCTHVWSCLTLIMEECVGGMGGMPLWYICVCVCMHVRKHPSVCVLVTDTQDSQKERPTYSGVMLIDSATDRVLTSSPISISQRPLGCSGPPFAPMLTDKPPTASLTASVRAAGAPAQNGRKDGPLSTGLWFPRADKLTFSGGVDLKIRRFLYFTTCLGFINVPSTPSVLDVSLLWRSVLTV